MPHVGRCEISPRPHSPESDETRLGLTQIRRRWPAVAAGLVIALSGIGVYLNSLDGVKLMDDHGSITVNRTIQRLWPIWPVLKAHPRESSTLGRPVANVSLAINYAIHGLKVRGYHIFNIAIHVLAGLTLFGVVRRTLLLPSVREHFLGYASTGVAFAVALLWTVHPLQTESVTYIIQRIEAMVGLFYLLTFYCVIRGATGGRKRLWYVFAVAAYLLGVATKEVMATGPLLLLLYDRLFLAGSFREALKRRWRLYGSLTATWVLLGLLVLTAEGRKGTAGFGLGVSVEEYALTQPYYVARYLWLSVWPGPLVFDYGRYLSRGFWQIAPYTGIVLALLTAVAVGLRYRPRVAFAGAWVFVVLAPTSSVIPVVTQTGAEHRMYLPLAGVVTLMVLAAYFLWQRLCKGWGALSGRFRWAVPGCLLLAAAGALSARTVLRNRDYHSALGMWELTLVQRPQNERAYDNYGWALYEAGRTDEAIEQFNKALALMPDLHYAYAHLALCMLDKDQPDEAIRLLRRAVELQPQSPWNRWALGRALVQQERIPEAVGQFREALRLDSEETAAHLGLGEALYEQGNLPEARKHLQIAADSRDPEARAHHYLALVLLRQGHRDQAIREYEEALRLKSDFIESQNNLAWVLATQPGPPADATRAVELAQRVCESSKHEDPHHLDTLAAAYAAAGLYEDAIQMAEKALRLAGADKEQESFVRKLRARLELYRQHRPYLEMS